MEILLKVVTWWLRFEPKIFDYQFDALAVNQSCLRRLNNRKTVGAEMGTLFLFLSLSF